MKSKAYKMVLYIARIALIAIIFGAGALTVIVMWHIPLIGLVAVLTAVSLDIIQRFDSRKGANDHDSGRNES